jgi:hypothetical protein
VGNTQQPIASRLEWEPKTLCEVYLALNESGEIFYQFTGLNGAKAEPVIVYNLLRTTADALANDARATQQAQQVLIENVTEQKGVAP